MIVWITLLLLLWGGGLWVASISYAPNLDVSILRFSMALVLGIVTLTSYLPILLLFSFLSNEGSRALDVALTEARHLGWDQRFQGEIRGWYRRVFDPGRYPIPATLALTTFIAGWTYVFFYGGAWIIAPVADAGVGSGLQALTTAVVNGPPASYAFLGSYLFSAWFLFKRCIRGDLGPAVFIHIAVRTWLATILALVLTAVWGAGEVLTPAQRATLSGVVFVGGITPTVLLQLIVSSVVRTIGRGRYRANEASLSRLGGMNPWKEARLTEEGIDNVQNLAMEDPSRLVVVTREGGLRILDWLDQAILYNAAPEELRPALGSKGIRTAFDLYLWFDAQGLLKELGTKQGETSRYEVRDPAEGEFSDKDGLRLRNVLRGIVHHPNFEQIRQMRQQAMRSASDLFTTLELRPHDQHARTDGLADRISPGDLISRVQRGTLVVASTEFGGALMAMGVALDPLTAVTVVDVGATGIGFQPVDQELGPGARILRGTQSRVDLEARLAAFHLEQPVEPITIAANDPAPLDRVWKFSRFSGVQAGFVNAVGDSMTIQTGDGEVRLNNVTTLQIASAQGDGGAPIFNERLELVAVAIAGAREALATVPVSQLRSLLDGESAGSPRRLRDCVRQAQDIHPQSPTPAVPRTITRS